MKITVFRVRSNKIGRILILLPGLPCVLFEDRGCTVLGLLSLMWAKAKQKCFLMRWITAKLRISLFKGVIVHSSRG